MAITDALSPADERNYLGFGFQTAQGSEAAPNQFLVFLSAVELEPGQQARMVREAGSAEVIARSIKDLYIPTVRGATIIRPDIGGAVMAALLGNAPVPSGVGPYTHTITRSLDTPWITWERNISDEETDRLVDGWIQEVVLRIAKRDQNPEPILDITGSALTPKRMATQVADAYETDRPFHRGDTTWTIDGSAESFIEDATVTMRWTIDEGMVFDSLTRGCVKKISFETDIEVTQVLKNEADVERYRAIYYGSTTGTAVAENVYVGDFDVEWNHTQGGAAYPPGGTEQRQFKLTIPVVAWTDAQITGPDPEAREGTRVRFNGHLLNNTGGEEITCTVINNRSTAYLT